MPRGPLPPSLTASLVSSSSTTLRGLPAVWIRMAIASWFPVNEAIKSSDSFPSEDIGTCARAVLLGPRSSRVTRAQRTSSSFMFLSSAESRSLPPSNVFRSD